MQDDIRKMLEKLDTKLDDLKDTVHGMAVTGAAERVRLAQMEGEILSVKKQLRLLQEAHDKARGVLKLLTVPGFASLIYALYSFLHKP